MQRGVHAYPIISLSICSYSLAIEKRQEKAKPGTEAGPSATQPAPSAEGSPVPSESHPTPNAGTSNLPPRDDGGHESGHEEDGAAHGAGPKSGKDAHPPTKKYRLTEDMRALIWQLVCLSNECCRIENEKK